MKTGGWRSQSPAPPTFPSWISCSTPFQSLRSWSWASACSGPTAPLPIPICAMASTGVATNSVSTRFVASLERAALTAANRASTWQSWRKTFRVIFSWSLEKKTFLKKFQSFDDYLGKYLSGSGWFVVTMSAFSTKTDSLSLAGLLSGSQLGNINKIMHQ